MNRKYFPLLMFFIAFGKTQAQTYWQTDGNYTDSSSVIGTKKHEPFQIITDNELRVTVDPDGNVMIPNNSLMVDSIRTRVIHVGDSSLVIGSNQTNSPNNVISSTSTSTSTIEIQPYNGITYFSSNPFLNTPRVGIGTATPNAVLHLYLPPWPIQKRGVFELFNNNYGGDNSPDGFVIGIASNEDAVLNQKLKYPMKFSTWNIQRMMITYDGKVGIGTTYSNPATTLDVQSTTPQLRLTNDATQTLFAQFATTSNGDLQITTSNAGAQQDVVIGIPLTGGPTAKLDVNGEYNSSGIIPTLHLNRIITPSGTNSEATFILRNWGMLLNVKGQSASDRCLYLGNSNPVFTTTNSKLYVDGDMILSQPQNATTGNGGNVLVWDATDGRIKINSSVVGSTSVSACMPFSYPNYLSKWNNANNELCKSLLYDDGINITLTNLTSTVGGAFFNVISTNGNPNGISTSVTTTGNARALNASAFSTSTTGSFNYGIISTASGAFATNYGILCGAGGGNSNLNFGIASYSHDVNLNSGFNIGVLSWADAATNNSAGNFCVGPTTTYLVGNVGVLSLIQGLTNNTSTNYAIYGDAGGAVNYWAAYFNGQGYLSAGLWQTSDSILKTNVQPLINSLSLIRQLSPSKYIFKYNQYPYLRLPSSQQYGLLAENLETVLPSLVTSVHQPKMIDSTGTQVSPALDFKAVNYIGLIPILLEAIQELDSVNQILVYNDSVNDARLDIIENSLGLTGNTGLRSTNSENNTKVILSDAKGIILNQNDPNPFSESTIISYSIAESFQKAEIIFSDNVGRVLKSVSIAEKGKGELTVYASDLSSGIYRYSLLVDGKLIETKQMVYQAK